LCKSPNDRFGDFLELRRAIETSVYDRYQTDLDLALAHYPPSVASELTDDELLHKAQSLVVLRRYQQALEVYSKVIERSPKTVRAWLERGRLLTNLSGHIEEAMASLKQAQCLAEDELRLAKEAAQHHQIVQTAAQLQRSLLNSSLLAATGLCFARDARPCENLAFDLLHIFQLDDDHVGLYLFDVSGRGFLAAHLASILALMLSPAPCPSTLLRVPQPSGTGYQIVPPAEVARQLNGWFLANPIGEHYFTLFYGILEVRSRCLRYVSAGHPSLVYVPTDSEPSHLRAPGFPIGCLEDAEYEERLLSLRTGD